MDLSKVVDAVIVGKPGGGRYRSGRKFGSADDYGSCRIMGTRASGDR
jgi:hypothetical protein